MEFWVLEYIWTLLKLEFSQKVLTASWVFVLKIFSFMLTKSYPEEHSWEKAFRAEEPLVPGTLMTTGHQVMAGRYQWWLGCQMMTHSPQVITSRQQMMTSGFQWWLGCQVMTHSPQGITSRQQMMTSGCQWRPVGVRWWPIVPRWRSEGSTDDEAIKWWLAGPRSWLQLGTR